MKIASCLAGILLLLAGCAKPPPFQGGDTLVSRQDGTVLGKVLELGNHSFENGMTGPSVHLMLPSGHDAWYSMDTTVGNYVVRN